MTAFARSSVLSAVLALSYAPSVCAQTVELEFTTTTGETLVLLPIESMECAEMDKMLARIDSTRYRENAPTPHNSDDEPLFEYELMLAEENYTRCVVVRKKVTGGLLIMRRSKSN